MYGISVGTHIAAASKPPVEPGSRISVGTHNSGASKSAVDPASRISVGTHNSMASKSVMESTASMSQVISNQKQVSAASAQIGTDEGYHN